MTTFAAWCGVGTGFGAEGHAEAAWRRLRAPGESAASLAESVDAFAAACRAIEERGPAAVARLAALAGAPEPDLAPRASAAARILAEVGTIDAATALLRIAMLPDIEVASRALDALSSMRPSQAAQTMLADVVRASAGAAVARVAPLAPLAPAAPLAPRAMGPGDAHRGGLLADALGRQLLHDADFEATSWAAAHPLAQVRAAWARALGRAGGEAATRHLPGLLDDEDGQVRAWAAFGLVLAGRLEAVAALGRCARSRSAGERAAAIGLLGVLPLPHAVPAVVAATSDRSPIVARAAILRAGQLGTREALVALADQLDHRRTDIVEHAAWALRDLLGHDPGFAWSGRRLSAASAAAVRARCRAVADAWPAETRHLLGRPLSAEAASEALDGSTGRDPHVAYFTLLGMAGASHGYDPSADVVANRRAIRLLREWARERGGALSPGGFYLRGERVSRLPR